MKILILKPSSLGDVVHALPVLRLLKSHWPKSEIFWWLESGNVPLLADDPDLTGIFSFSRRSWFSPLANVPPMRRQRFDLAIDLQGLFRSGLFAWLANAETIVGLDNPREGAREGARLFYDSLTPRAPFGTHAVDRYLGVLTKLGVPIHDRFQWLPERPQLAETVREKWKTASARWIILLPGARWDNKRWPLEHFISLVRKVASSSSNVKFAILGSGADAPLGRAIAETNPEHCLDLTAKTSLLELIEWLRLSEFVVTNDTGPMHLAAALRKPIIAMFGPTDPDGTGPYGQRKNVLQLTEPPCIPCMKSQCSWREPIACLKNITPEQVYSELRARIVI